MQLFIVVIGPDGVGKSSVCYIMIRRFKTLNCNVWHFHWRPGFLPKLRRCGIVNAHSDRVQVPFERSRYTGMITLLRFAYYWIDFVIGYGIIIRRRKAKNGLVVGERYFPDVLVQPERYGFAVPRWLMRAAAWFVPKPDLVVLLKDDPHVIHARKPELSPARIAKLLAAYEEEMQHWGNARILTTEGGPEAVAERLTQMIIQERSARTVRQIERAR